MHDRVVKSTRDETNKRKRERRNHKDSSSNSTVSKGTLARSFLFVTCLLCTRLHYRLTGGECKRGRWNDQKCKQVCCFVIAVLKGVIRVCYFRIFKAVSADRLFAFFPKNNKKDVAIA